MASILRVNTLTDASSNNSIATSVLHNGTAKVWINYNMATTSSIHGSYNVSSITDNMTGDATISYSSNMNNTNYAQTDGTGDENEQFNNSRALAIVGTGRKTTSATRFDTGGQTVNAGYDFKENSVLIHGDLA